MKKGLDTGMANVLSFDCGGGSRKANLPSAESALPAIVLVAFGTLVPEARKVFDHVAAQARQRYPGYTIHWAFTSQHIIRKLKSQEIETKTLPEVLADLRASGVTAVAIQSFHVSPGQEYEEIQNSSAEGLRITVGQPLLMTDADIAETVAALKPSFRPGIPNIVVAHGNSRFPQFNAQNLAFDRQLRATLPNARTATVEGDSGGAALTWAREQARQAKAVHFVPLMLVAGDHVMNDVMGDEPAAWKNIVGADAVTAQAPLGYNDAVLAIWFRHLDAALKLLGNL